jgi:RNA polymerase sigma-70 factor (ECF subfamily)
LIQKALSLFDFFDRPNQGKLEEFKEHYLQTKDFIRSSIYWMVRSEAVDDILQESYLKAWKKYSTFAGHSSFKSWIYRIAMNTSYDYLKKESKNHISYIDPDQLSKDFDYEIGDVIEKGILNLTPKQREVFNLYFKMGLRLTEIADLLQISQGTVKSRIHYAKTQFVSYLEKNGVRYE